ncbi:hypothetical protein [Cupriavidus basilensis]
MPPFRALSVALLAAALLTGCEKAPDPQNEKAEQIPQKEQVIPDIILPKEDIKAFTGKDQLVVGGAIASITLPQSDDEKRLINEGFCVDETECYGVNKFDRYLLTKYPDIKKIRYIPTKDLQEDKEGLEQRKLDFRRGLYFAKEIKLANGQTLFDFLKNCSKSISPYNFAEIAYQEQKLLISMQFFPILRKKASGEAFEEQILFDRRGDTIQARSPWFSTSILKSPDFMGRHGLECWR